MIKRKFGTIVFIGLLSIQAIAELGIGISLLFNFPETLKNGFGITYTTELKILGIALGLYLLLLTTLMILSVIWTIKRNLSGATLGIILAIFLITFGLTSFLALGNVQALYVDSFRGIITLIFGYMAYKELKKQN
tara:strand:+ start:431 stop:835 length:405 start_codon:yes stop_codon:yes gene_type:complete